MAAPWYHNAGGGHTAAAALHDMAGIRPARSTLVGVISRSASYTWHVSQEEMPEQPCPAMYAYLAGTLASPIALNCL